MAIDDAEREGVECFECGVHCDDQRADGYELFAASTTDPCVVHLYCSACAAARGRREEQPAR